MVTVAIIVILLGVSAVAVVRYIDYLEITELDNAAREIFMAAQNRAVLLSGNQRLAGMIESDGVRSLSSKQYNGDTDDSEIISLLATGDEEDEEEEDRYRYLDKNQVRTLGLLDTGNIDPTLLEDGHYFYIIYDTISGNVTDVIYAKSSLENYEDPNVFAVCYNNWWSTSKSVRVETKRQSSDAPLVGWYHGDPSQGTVLPPPPDEKPDISVEINNGEELTVTVTVRWGDENGVTDPEVKNAVVEAINSHQLKVWLGPDVDGSDVGIDLMDLIWERSRRVRGDYSGTASVADDFYSCTWLLDSLQDSYRPSNLDIRFKDLSNTGVVPGQNFRVTATIPKQGTVLKALSASDADNSLFAEDSEPGNGIARIACLRHLQNLDAGNSHASGVTGIIAAIQKNNIFGSGNEKNGTSRIYAGYQFIPIINNELKSYNGYADDEEKMIGLEGNQIRNLSVDVDNNKNEFFGLFSKTPEGFKFSNIRLVNTVVKAGSGASVGALVGQSSDDTTIMNCWVYWEAGEDVDDLKVTLGTDVSQYDYQLTGEFVGGLVGTAGGQITIENSLAATMVSGVTAAGGLVGQMNASVNTITKSYADCYLTGDNRVAGLVGNLAIAATLVDLKYCYSAGFIQINSASGFKAAGLCLGNGKTATTSVYTVMRYLKGVDLSSIKDNELSDNVYYLTENQKGGNDSFDNFTYYWGAKDSKATAESIKSKSCTYEDMTNNSFVTKMDYEGAGVNFDWFPVTHAYNLREFRTLITYNFPGLVGLDHYGDWDAKFKEPSLVYYEQYNVDTNGWGISGGNARNLVSNADSSTLRNGSVLSDGYAVAFLDNTVKNCDVVSIRYSYLNDSDTESLKTECVQYDKNDWLARTTTWKDEDTGDYPTAYLIPLPDKLVYNEHAQGSFYHYVKFELFLGKKPDEITVNMEADASGEYFFNPHFAEAIQPYTGTPNPSKWTDEMTAEADRLADSMGAISIRTPRHLYDLSLFEVYYNNSSKERRYAFRQYLDLDYSIYQWKGKDKGNNSTNNTLIFNLTEGLTGDDSYTSVSTKPYKQKPIGTQSAPFTGSYNGGYCLIKNVIPDMKELKSDNRYVGLFGNFNGIRMENIVYQMGPDVNMGTVKTYADSDYDNYRLSVENGSIAGGMYIGGLVGFSNGMINNCAVYGADMKVTVSGIYAYVGGMVGRNEGTITNCSAETNALTVDGSGFARIYAGGFVGENYNSGSISSAYAVGRINGEVKNSDALLCGFAGTNSGTISNAYAAVDLEPSGGAEAYGFCKIGKGSLKGKIVYLDDGSYTYRKDSYTASYEKKDEEKINDGGESYTYAELEEATSSSLFNGMRPAASSMQGGGTDTKYPFPAVVRNADGYVHYGLWTTRMALGQMGVFYWEKLEIDNIETYHIYALVVNPKDGTISKQSTLSTAHDDGGVITEYGYGYYYEKGRTVNLDVINIAYYEYNTKKNGPNKWETDPTIGETGNGGNAADYFNDLEDFGKNVGRDTALANQMEGYTFRSWESYHEGALSQLSSGAGDFRKAQATAGLNIFMHTGYDGEIPNRGSFILTQNKGTANEVKVRVIINPQFAASMSVHSVSGSDFTVKDGLDSPPGSSANPYQVRSGMQLQQINWYKGNYVDVSVGNAAADGINRPVEKFPYLGGSNKSAQYVWEQTHDIDWVAEGNIYYVCDKCTGDNQYVAVKDAEAHKKNNPAHTLTAGVGVFYSIAHVAVTGNELPGWFEGIYDGHSYAIKNLNVYANLHFYQPNTMGLFGVVNRNAKLRDIVLYSEGGSDTITIWGRRDGTGKEDMWYAAGVLAGVAIDSTIQNCAVAGYTIVDQTKNSRSTITEKKSYTFTITLTRSGNGGNATNLAGEYDVCSERDDNAKIEQDSNTLDTKIGTNYYYFKIGSNWYQFNYNKNDNSISNVRQVGGRNNLTGYTYALKPSEHITDGPSAYDMGGAIGGLVGIAHGTALSGCTAIVDIKLEKTFKAGYTAGNENLPDSYESYNHSRNGAEAPIRVGGLVGSTTSSVTNCYTGGEITVASDAYSAKVYVGRIIGGIGAEPLPPSTVATAPVTVRYCYSYVSYEGALVSTSEKPTVLQAYYNIGGSDNKDVSLSDQSTNNYYLTNANAPTRSTGIGEGINYKQLSGEESIIEDAILVPNVNDIYGMLKEGGYSPVSTSVGNLAASGRYTFVPSRLLNLQGLDYPFPTILKRDGNNVHYGAWTLYGIERYEDKYEEIIDVDSGEIEIKFAGEKGGEPVELDLFKKEDGRNEFGFHEEYLKLSKGVVAGGDWNVIISEGGEKVIAVELGKEEDGTAGDDWNTLSITALDKSDTPVTVTITYTEQDSNVPYTLKINVYVTAVIDLTPSKISVFPNDVVKLDLELDLDLNDDDADGDDTAGSSKGSLTLKEGSAKSTNRLVGAKVENNQLVLSTDQDAEGTVYVEVEYEYILDGNKVEDRKRIEVTVLPLPEHLWKLGSNNTWTWTMDFKVDADDEKYALINEIRFDVNDKPTGIDNVSIGEGKRLTLEKSKDEEFVRNTASLPLTVTTVESGFTFVHEVNIIVPKPVTSTDLKLKIKQNITTEDVAEGWVIDFGDYRVLNPENVGTDKGFTPELLEDGNVVLNRADSSVGLYGKAGLKVMLTNNRTGLREEIALDIVLPELTAELYSVDYKGDTPIYSWIIDLGDNSMRPEDAVTLEVSEGYQAVYSEDKKSVIITAEPNELDSAGGEGTTNGEKSTELTVTLTPNGSPTEIYTLTVDLPLPDDSDVKTKGMELQMLFPGDTVKLTSDDIFADVTGVNSSEISIKTVTSNNGNVEAALDEDGNVILNTKSSAGNLGDAYVVGVVYTYSDTAGKIVTGTTKITVKPLTLPQGMWTADTDKNNLEWTMDRLDSSITITEQSAVDAEGNTVPTTADSTDEGTKITLKPDAVPTSEIKLTFTATIGTHSYVHTVEITVPKPVTEGELVLKVEQAEGGWKVSIDEYEVVAADEDAARTATEASGNSIVIKDADSVSTSLTVILSKGGLRQQITLEIVLPKLDATPNAGADDTESGNPDWNISLDRYKDLVKSVKLTVGAGDEESFKVIPETEIAPEPDVSSGDEIVSIDPYKLEYIGDGDIPEDVTLDITIVTNKGLTEYGTLTIPLSADNGNGSISNGDISNDGINNGDTSNGDISGGDVTYRDGDSIREGSANSANSVTSGDVLDVYLTDNQNENEYSDDEESEGEPADTADQQESE